MSDLHEAILNQLNVPIAVVSPTGSILFQNRSFQETFGSEADPWFRTGLRSLAGERGWLQGFFDGEDNHSVEEEFKGRIYRVEKIMSAAVDHGVALMLDDVTRQTEAEQARSDFTSMVVHDLRGPLSGIQATLDFVLQDDEKIGPMHHDLLKEAMLESERMMNLINEILDFSKIRSGKFTIEAEPVRLTAMLKRTVLSLQAVAARQQVNLLSAHGADLPTILGSAEKLTQAIINLLSNALKFTPANGVISLAAHALPSPEHPESVLITVTDTGVGISEEDLGVIFQRYEQSRSRSVTGEAGTGLGLYIAREIIEAHGGSLDVASIEGVGTSLVIRLPLRPEPKDSPAKTPPRPVTPS